MSPSAGRSVMRFAMPSVERFAKHSVRGSMIGSGRHFMGALDGLCEALYEALKEGLYD